MTVKNLQNKSMRNTTYLIESLKYIDFLNANTDWEPMMKNFSREFAKIKAMKIEHPNQSRIEWLEFIKKKIDWGRMQRHFLKEFSKPEVENMDVSLPPLTELLRLSNKPVWPYGLKPIPG